MNFIFDPSLVLYLPLHQLDDASFMSLDAYGRLVTVTGAVWRPYGRFFDGTDDYIILPAAAGLDAQGTIELWFKVNDPSGAGQQYLWLDQQDGNNQNRIMVSSNTLRFYGYDNGAYQYQLDASLTDSDWHHAVGVFQDNDARLYLDGELKASDTSVDIDAYTHNYVFLGCYSMGTPTNFLAGLIGEVRFYRRVLTPQEIQRNYQATKWRYR